MSGASPELEQGIDALKAVDGIQDVVVITRSGMFLAGNVPKPAHMETFVAMFAILLGSAETATSELKGELEEIIVNLEDSTVVVVSAGPKALVVAHVDKSAEIKSLVDDITVFSTTVEGNM